MSTIVDRFALPETQFQVDFLKQSLEEMKNHRVFDLVKTKEDLQVFMQMHCYAVWDFMTLLKRIQTEYTGMRWPWAPPHPKRARLARLVNEIVLAEESDDDGQGGYCSHFVLYEKAMLEVGADINTVNSFLMKVRMGIPPVESAARALINLSEEVRNAVMAYIGDTTSVARNAPNEEVVAYFLFGREDSVPAMFSNLLAKLGDLKESAPVFVRYLQRHIELDGEHHSAAVAELLEVELDKNPIRTKNALNAAINAVKARIALWEAVAFQLEERQRQA